LPKRAITVTQLKCACLDPAWLAAWLRGENPPTLLFSTRSGFPVQGSLFHQLADQFSNWLVAPGEKKKAAALVQPEELWEQLYERCARVKLDELIAAEKLPSAHHLSQALRAFCASLAELRARTPNFRSWQDVFFTSEFQLEAIRFADGSGELFVSGRPDAVRSHPQDGIEVVDYKLSRGGNLKHDLLQLAIYARLLRETKPGLRFSGVLEFYEPELHLVPAKVAELDGLFEEVVHPVIRQINHSLGSSDGGSPAPQSTPPSKGRDGSAKGGLGNPEADAFGALIRKTYADFRLNVSILGWQEAPQLIRYRVQPAGGVKVVSLANRADDLQVALRLSQPPLIRAAPGCVTIDLPKEKPATVLWSALPRDPKPLVFPIGIGIDGEVIIADFSDANMCHLLVAGTSGSGKSEFLKAMVASFLVKHPPGALKLSVVDPKILTFGALKDSRHLTGPVMTHISDAIACLDAAVAEMNARYAQLAREGFENLSQRGANEKMPFRVIIFDEFADLVLAGREEREQFESLVARIAQKGRAAGIHLVLATQRPDSKIVTGLIKSNLPLKVCLRVVNSTNSQIVLDEPGAESLLGRGDLLCQRGRGLERAQAPFVSQEELRALAT
jgi:S-DNA-T family DNA segregation ATPase FtsK/SpoIIIE